MVKKNTIGKDLKAAVAKQRKAYDDRWRRQDNDQRIKDINKELDRLYAENEKLDAPDGSTPYNKTLWPQINALEDELWDIDNKYSEEYYSEINKISDEFFDSYEKKYGDVKLQDLYDIDASATDDLINTLSDYKRADRYFTTWVNDTRELSKNNPGKVYRGPSIRR